MSEIKLKREKFKKYMENRGYGVSEIADQMGLHNSTLYRILNGERLPSPKFISAVTENLGLNYYEYFEASNLTDDKNKKEGA